MGNDYLAGEIKRLEDLQGLFNGVDSLVKSFNCSSTNWDSTVRLFGADIPLRYFVSTAVEYINDSMDKLRAEGVDVSVLSYINRHLQKKVIPQGPNVIEVTAFVELFVEPKFDLEFGKEYYAVRHVSGRVQQLCEACNRKGELELLYTGKLHRYECPVCNGRGYYYITTGREYKMYPVKLYNWNIKEGGDVTINFLIDTALTGSNDCIQVRSLATMEIFDEYRDKTLPQLYVYDKMEDAHKAIERLNQIDGGTK